jgi:nucleotide-binding universal stress UspA family protein
MRIASWVDAPLHVLHVVDSGDVPEDLLDKEPAQLPRMTWRERVKEGAQSNFDSFLMGNLVGGLKLQRHLVWGRPWQEIGQLAKRLDNALVVLGTVGRSGIQGMLLGNTAEKVLSTCDCSILTVKPAGFVSPIQPAGWQLHPAPIELADANSASSQ